MISADSKNGRVFFRGRGIEFLRFSSCVCREAGDEVVRNETPGLISLPEECLPAIIDCLRNFGLECQNFSDLLGEFAAHESARKTALRILKSGDDSGLPPPWDSRLKGHQKIAVKAMTVKGLRGLCLFDEQGTGKTAMALAAFDVMREAGDADILFVVGPKSVLGEWEKDCRRFLGGKYEVSIIAGNQNEKIDALSKARRHFRRRIRGLKTNCKFGCAPKSMAKKPSLSSMRRFSSKTNTPKGQKPSEISAKNSCAFSFCRARPRRILLRMSCISRMSRTADTLFGDTGRPETN